MGPRTGFAEFMAEHEPGLLRFAMTLAGDHHISEDLVGDTLAMMCEKWDHVASLDHPLAYARRTLVNHYISSCRRKSRWQRAMPKLFSGQRTVGEADSGVGDRLAMRQRLEKLPPRQRAVLAMRYYLDLSDEQIAEQLACGR